jgi:hypothetical protein
VPSCLEACNRRFQGAAADGVSWADLNTFYSMPDTLRGGVLKQAGEVFAAKLRAAYLHLEEAWRDDALRLQFCELPLGAVEALAALDELRVISENTVAAALATWLAHDLPGRRAAGKQLLGLIRLQHLSQCYVREVLPRLPGLGEHLSVEQLLEALQYEKVPAVRRRHIESLAALKPPRAQPASRRLRFEWRISTASLMELVQQALQPEPALGRVESGVHRYNGFALQAVACTGFSSAGGAPYMYIILEASVPPELAKLPGISSTCALISGMAEVAGAQAGEPVRFDLDWNMMPFMSERRAYIWHLKLGEGCVHDACTLVAALTGSERHVTAINEPAPAARVAELREVPLVFNFINCT